MTTSVPLQADSVVFLAQLAVWRTHEDSSGFSVARGWCNRLQQVFPFVYGPYCFINGLYKYEPNWQKIWLLSLPGVAQAAHEQEQLRTLFRRIHSLKLVLQRRQRLESGLKVTLSAIGQFDKRAAAVICRLH